MIIFVFFKQKTAYDMRISDRSSDVCSSDLTEFCNTYAAYDDLSDADKAAYSQLKAMHSAWNTLFYYDPEPNIEVLRGMMRIGDRELPLVWNHRSGRKSLVIGATARHIVDRKSVV